MTEKSTSELEPCTISGGKVTRKEILAWASYDIANSTYGTVVATAVYNAYFVNVVAGSAKGIDHGLGTVLLTTIICVSALLVVLTAPIVGTIADAHAAKKKLLFLSTFGCILATASLSLVGPGAFVAGMIIMILANMFFGTGEDLIAAFLPELAQKEQMGRISALGWSAGYVGGLFSLSGCLAYIHWAKGQGQVMTQYVPSTMLICAACFAMASLPTFLFLKERAKPDPEAQRKNPFKIGFARLKATFNHARYYEDLFNFLIALFFYSCGTTTIIHMASVYAQEVMHFTPSDSIVMILVVNVTAAVGAIGFGFMQDRIGSIKTLSITLGIWIVAILVAVLAQNKMQLWIAANIVGTALGASGSAGRALVGQFSPPGRSGEFLGLWGVAVKLATAYGAVSFGAITYLTGSNFRIGLLSTNVFFIIGLLLLFRVNERRGRVAAQQAIEDVK